MKHEEEKRKEWPVVPSIWEHDAGTGKSLGPRVQDQPEENTRSRSPALTKQGMKG
jgi:hypothetical protein